MKAAFTPLVHTLGACLHEGFKVSLGCAKLEPMPDSRQSCFSQPIPAPNKDAHMQSKDEGENAVAVVLQVPAV